MYMSLLAQITIILLLLVVVLALTNQDRRPYYAFLFLVFKLVDSILLRLPSTLGLQQGFDWNWIGKFLTIAWVLVFLWIGPLSAKNIGLTLKHHAGSIIPALQVTVVFIAVKGLGAIFMRAGSSNAITETLLFQITMPGLAEEPAYQGILLALMILALGGKPVSGEFQWNRISKWAVFITAITFGVVHALSYHAGFQFDFSSFLFPFLAALVFAWLRLSTGSLLFPILAHNGGNFTYFLISYLLE